MNRKFSFKKRIIAILSLVLLASNIFLSVAMAGVGDSNGVCFDCKEFDDATDNGYISELSGVEYHIFAQFCSD